MLSLTFFYVPAFVHQHSDISFFFVFACQHVISLLSRCIRPVPDRHVMVMAVWSRKFSYHEVIGLSQKPVETMNDFFPHLRLRSSSCSCQYCYGGLYNIWSTTTVALFLSSLVVETTPTFMPVIFTAALLILQYTSTC